MSCGWQCRQADGLGSLPLPTSPAGRHSSCICSSSPAPAKVHLPPSWSFSRAEMRCVPYGSPGSGYAAALVVSSLSPLPCCKLAARARLLLQAGIGWAAPRFQGLLAAVLCLSWGANHKAFQLADADTAIAISPRF